MTTAAELKAMAEAQGQLMQTYLEKSFPAYDWAANWDEAGLTIEFEGTLKPLDPLPGFPKAYGTVAP